MYLLGVNPVHLGGNLQESQQGFDESYELLWFLEQTLNISTKYKQETGPAFYMIEYADQNN